MTLSFRPRKATSCFLCCKAFSAARVMCLMQPKSTSSAVWPPGFQSSDWNTAMAVQLSLWLLFRIWLNRWGLYENSWSNASFIIQANVLSSQPTAKTLSAMAQISSRAWCKPRLTFRLIPEDQMNKNLCLNTANTAPRQKSATTPQERLCVISLKGRWGQSVCSASTQYQVYCGCATAGNATQPLVCFEIHYEPQNRH